MDNEKIESIVTRGNLVNHNLMLSLHPRWFTILTLGLCGLIKNHTPIIRFVSSFFSMKLGLRDFQTIRNTIYNAIHLSRWAIVIFALDWAAFAKYTEQLSEMELEKDEKSVNQINRERKIKNWFCFVSLIAYTTSNIVFILPWFKKIGIYGLYIPVVDVITLIGHLFIIYLIVDLSICLKAAFQYINYNLAHFSRDSPDLMLSELRRNRSLYSCAIRSSQKAEKFARHYIAWFYFQFILFNIVNIVDVLGQAGETKVVFVIFMGLDVISLAYLTVKLVAVNKVAACGMEDLYEISYHLKSYNLQNENNLFLNRMLWQNVGFTFSNLFLINPNFITSLLSFMLTVALMVANFLYT